MACGGVKMAPPHSRSGAGGGAALLLVLLLALAHFANGRSHLGCGGAHPGFQVTVTGLLSFHASSLLTVWGRAARHAALAGAEPNPLAQAAAALRPEIWGSQHSGETCTRVPCAGAANPAKPDGFADAGAAPRSVAARRGRSLTQGSASTSGTRTAPASSPGAAPPARGAAPRQRWRLCG